MNFILPIVSTLVGTLLFIRLGGFFVLHPLGTLKTLFNELKSKSARRALALALAGTLGVGNIFGVCVGIKLGGEGSVLWLLVSSLFSMVIKYSEASLSYDSKVGSHGGMHRVIDARFFGKCSLVSHLYALLCLLLALFMGAGVQSLAVYDVALGVLGKYAPLVLILFVTFAYFGCRRGVGKIEKITEILIPFITIVYILMCLSSVIINFSTLPSVISRIFSSALLPRAIGGGVLSFLSSRALSEGYARGILSNEAGIGTSSMSHSRGELSTAHAAGLFSMCEVFFDTVLLCPLTALTVLCSTPEISESDSAMDLISNAFRSTLGDPSVYVLIILVLLFAYSTVICWFYYGEECREYLFRGKCRRAYPLVFFAFCIFSFLFDESLMLFVTDNLILLMSVITLTVLTVFSKRISLLRVENR